MALTATLSKLSDALKGALKYSNSTEASDTKSVKNLYDYKTKRATYYHEMVEKLGKEILEHPAQDIPFRQELEKAFLIQLPQRYAEMQKIVEQMRQHFSRPPNTNYRPPNTDYRTPTITVTLPRLPEEIKDEIYADIAELGRCFDAACYRSAIVLCGRILETTLHRKYFEVIGKDILETQPGIGLGTLVAKLKEKNVAFDPAITQQIHLINNIRISSVHKKNEPFIPTRAQAHATILYTMDIVERMFKK